MEDGGYSRPLRNFFKKRAGDQKSTFEKKGKAKDAFAWLLSALDILISAFMD